jgi:hypothetical protein
METVNYLKASQKEINFLCAEIIENAMQTDLDPDDKIEVIIILENDYYFKVMLSCWVKNYPTPKDRDIQPSEPDVYISSIEFVFCSDEEGAEFEINPIDLENIRNYFNNYKL